MKTSLMLSMVVIALTACGQDTPTPDAEEATPSATPGVAVYESAIAAAGRLEGDYEKDATRKPGQVLQFLGIGPGDHVLDMFSGGGYYSEVISRVVGTDGRVTAHSNEPYLNFVGDEFNQRHAEGRLPNVDVLMAENNELALEAGTYDAIVMVLAYHDVYYDGSGSNDTWVPLDGPLLLAELHKGLKADGIVGIVDHRAAAGSPRATGNSLHRIDPAAVIADFEAAGFVLDDSSDLLQNHRDDHSIIVFDPAVRGNTDRFILRFRKAG